MSFYEPEPGVLGLSEGGPAGEAGLLSDVHESSVTALYRTLSGGAQPPLTLVEAEQRARAGAAQGSAPAERPPTAFTSSSGSESPAPPTNELPSTDVGGENIGTSAQALTAADGAWFAANGCFHHGDYHACLPNSGNFAHADGNVRTSFFTVAPYAGGTVYVQTSYNGAVRAVDPVFQGQWKNYWWESGLIYTNPWQYQIAEHTWDLLNASGKSFHYSVAANWNCGGPGTFTDCAVWPW